MFITASFKHVLGKRGKNQILKLVRDPSSAGRFYYIYYKRIRGDFITPQTYTIKRKKFPELNPHCVNYAVEKARGICNDVNQEDRNKKSLYSWKISTKNSRKKHLQ